MTKNDLNDGLESDLALIVIARHPLKVMFGAFGPKNNLERVPRSHHNGLKVWAFSRGWFKG